MRVPLALVALAALLAPRWSAASRGEEPPPTVPSPRQLVITSENFKTTLHWKYPPMSEMPRFIVEIKPYYVGYYKIVSTCVNISAHFCDLSREIYKTFDSHWLRVKAVVGSQQSKYVETNEFILQKHELDFCIAGAEEVESLFGTHVWEQETHTFSSDHKTPKIDVGNCHGKSGFLISTVTQGKIGPPKLNLSRHGDTIVVDIYHPALPSVELHPWIEEICLGLVYLVTFRASKNQGEGNFTADNCTMYKCVLSIPVPTEGSTYCVTAQGSLYDHLMLSTPSEESCIYVPLKKTLSTQYIIVLCVTLSLSLIVTVCCGCKKLRKKNIKLPKSLVSVIRNLNSDNILESKSEAKYVSVISVVSGQSALPGSDEVTSLEVEPKEETLSPENSSEGASFLPPPEAPAQAEEGSVQESTEDVSYGDEQNCKGKESYFPSDSGQMDICSNSSGSEVSATEIQQTVVPSSCLKFSGYDKPHVPLDMLIDVGEEQPVIAYRPTD